MAKAGTVPDGVPFCEFCVFFWLLSEKPKQGFATEGTKDTEWNGESRQKVSDVPLCEFCVLFWPSFRESQHRLATEGK
jgi:hypothetical protein